MTSMINWQVAQSRSRELRQLEAHPSARFVFLLFGRRSRRY